MIKEITHIAAKDFLKNYHYLNKSGAGFRSGINYGLFEGDELIAVCIYHTPSVSQTKKGMLNDQTKQVYEMGRLCLHPDKPYTLSQFVAGTFKDLKQTHREIDYILTYADESVHTGKIYQALSMTYYGLSSQKKDFWFKKEDGSYVKQQRGSVKGKEGEWRPRTRKHRYVKCLKKKLERCITWDKQNHREIAMKKNQEFNKK